ncbi:MAG TPA: cell division topological specificity factor MinE [Vibrio sp.]|uniref:Cell division topological specificity factor n=1 Tax=Vibrio algivorus TaxID=1667024 RepID=A0ABQ6ERZ7_9VIBR|nr:MULTISPECIES: cell division topological specificity factor MinE [Vibrio]GLT15722.1 cell division topological specificity factor [Vibrio algivorus]HCH01627.1 cell division topological specificity factor MinE [Vibrio sp.]
MSLLQFFRPKKKDTANLAKERLQIIVAERRNQGSANPSYLPQLKEDILQVLSKYVSVDPSMVNVSLEQGDDDLSVLELNIQLPEKEE